MDWDFKNGLPIYQQIIQIMQIKIASGEFMPGSKIPAVRELALEAGVNPNTMQRALAELEREGLLHAERTSGRFVTDDVQVLGQLRASLSSAFIQELYEKLRQLGMTEEEIADAITGERHEYY